MKEAKPEKTITIYVSSEKEFLELAPILIKEGYRFRITGQRFLYSYYHLHQHKTMDLKMVIYLNNHTYLTFNDLDRHKELNRVYTRLVSTEEYLFAKNKKRTKIPCRIN